MATEVPINSIINLNVPAHVPDGFTDPQVRAAVEMFINAQNNLLRTFEQYVAPTQKDMTTWSSLVASDTLLKYFSGRIYKVASENINFGDFVNLHDVAGVCNVRKANASSGTVRPARGYCSTVGGVLIGEIGEFILSQGLLTIGGVACGQAIFLSTSPGLATITAPVGAGQLEQFLGVGVETNLVHVDISLGQYIQH